MVPAFVAAMGLLVGATLFAYVLIVLAIIEDERTDAIRARRLDIEKECTAPG